MFPFHWCMHKYVIALFQFYNCNNLGRGQHESMKMYKYEKHVYLNVYLWKWYWALTFPLEYGFFVTWHQQWSHILVKKKKTSTNIQYGYRQTLTRKTTASVTHSATTVASLRVVISNPTQKSVTKGKNDKPSFLPPNIKTPEVLLLLHHHHKDITMLSHQFPLLQQLQNQDRQFIILSFKKMQHTKNAM